MFFLIKDHDGNQLYRRPRYEIVGTYETKADAEDYLAFLRECGNKYKYIITAAV